MFYDILYVMDLTCCDDSVFGSPTTTVGLPVNFVYYHPKHIPHDCSLSAATVSELAYADNTISELNTILLEHISRSQLFTCIFYKEALASTHIEGTYTSLEEVLLSNLANKNAIQSVDVQEVLNYSKASRLGVELLDTIPISSRFMRVLHQVLLQPGSGVRGEWKLPGQFRGSPVWIGSVGQTLSTATFVPPIPELVGDLIADWECYVHDITINPLVKTAVAHYQFETIHPFLDGNGRIGRLLIEFILQQENRLPYLLLGLSEFFDYYRDDYYRLLADVRETGDINAYLQFFFTAISCQATNTISRVKKLLTLHTQYCDQANTDRSQIGVIIPLLFEQPVLNSQYVRRKIFETGGTITIQSVHRLLQRAQYYGWITRQTTYGKSGSIIYYAQDILKILNTTY